MSIQTNFPAIKPSLLLDFANTKQLDPRITFTRASTATYYNGVTTAKAEQNFFTYSQNSTTNWTNFSNRLTITTSYEAAPDGTTTGMRLQNSSGSIGYFYQNVGSNLFVSGTTYTLSVYVKSNTGSTQTAQLMLPVTAASSNVSVTTSWTRVTWTVAASSTNSFAGIILDPATATDISVWGFQVEQRSTATAYTATTTQAITNYIPVLQTAASGVPRFDCNPTTDESLGLLIEESRTNISLRSEDFANAYWTSFKSSLTANSVVAPDGALTADLIVPDTTSSTAHGSYTTSPITVANATAYTLSVYAKAMGYNYLVLYFPNSPASSAAIFNLSTGAVGSKGSSVTSSSIISVGNGWYRCTLTATTTSTTGDIRVYAGSADNGDGTTVAFAGNGFSGIAVWGAQVEAGSFATSYIATVASQVTRAADSASMTGTNFSSWYNQAQGTLYAEALTPPASTYNSIAYISDGSVNNSIRLGQTSGGAAGFDVVAAGATSASFQATTIASTTSKQAGVVKVDDFARSVNAGAVSTDTSGLVPAVTQLQIGTNPSAQYLNGTIKKIAYYPLRVTNANLQALTS